MFKTMGTEILLDPGLRVFLSDVRIVTIILVKDLE